MTSRQTTDRVPDVSGIRPWIANGHQLRPDRLRPDVERSAIAREVMHLQRIAGNRALLGIIGLGKSRQPLTVQRQIYDGNDHAGRYEINDRRCTFDYYQRWFFVFSTNQSRAQRRAYLQSAERQVEDVWSRHHKLIPQDRTCRCPDDGFTVNIHLRTTQGRRRGRRGFEVLVTPTEQRGWTTQPSRDLDLGPQHQHPVPRPGIPGGQRIIAHEFGHTIGLTDEYVGWADLFGTAGSGDEPAIMNLGDEVRPRHYQPFADMLNLEVGGGRCAYAPGGVRTEYEIPVERWMRLPVTVLNERADFVIAPTYDRRISNEALLGLAHPTVGMMSLWDPRDRSVRVAPTIGLQLNQLAHPLYVNIRSGVVFDPRDPRTALELRIPFSLDIGLRGRGWEVGANYTVIPDFLGSGGWSHLVGVGGQF